MLEELLSTYGYLAILVITFLEGETIVILAGVAAYQGYMDLWLVLLTALTGSFAGDQLYYTIGRRFGAPLLQKWPALENKADWAFKLLRRWEVPFILSFRFIYGVRNVSPFVIAIAGVPRLRFMGLNLMAAALWACAFTFGGYYFGRALEQMVGEHQALALAILAAVLSVVGMTVWWRRRQRLRTVEQPGE